MQLSYKQLNISHFSNFFYLNSVMTNECLNIIIGVSTGVIGMLAFANEFPNKKIFNFFKTLGSKLIVFIIATTILIGATIKKDANTETQTLKDKLDAKSEQRKRDVENRRLTNESNSIIIGKVTSTLAKSYLKLDSNQDKLEKIIKDTTNKRITEITEKTVTTDALPDLDISQIQFVKLRNDTLEFNFEIDCKKTAVKDLNLTLKVLLLKEGLFTYVPQLTNFVNNINLSSNTKHTVDVVNITTLKNIYRGYFYITGYYYYNGVKILYDNMLYYDFKLSKFGFPGDKLMVQPIFNQYP
jgi:hypothetical protein